MSEWKPIETAPKDGTGILGFWKNTGSDRVELHQYGLTIWRGHGWFSMDLDDDCEYTDPTHWMPLPAPPSNTSTVEPVR